jgi:sphingolipid delta-4 desaturase
MSMMATDFEWAPNDEPHRTRRKEMLEKYGDKLRSLMIKEWRTCPIVIAIVTIQLAMAWWAQNYASGWQLFIAAWVIGGTINHSLQLAVHELSHNLCFHWEIMNRVLAIFANLPTGVPSAVSFQRFHMEHHLFQGADGIDTDIPTKAEVSFFTSTALKVLWVFLQPAFYGIRPFVVKPYALGSWEVVNTVIVVGCDIAVLTFIGRWALVYLIAGTLLGLGWHPAAGHFIAEHYTFTPGQETYSYYGPCNWVNFNVGYHNEHHDFPKIPWSNLPKVREVAPEYYKMPHYTSYCAVMWRYVTDPRIGPASRLKRAAPARYYKKADDKSE